MGPRFEKEDADGFSAFDQARIEKTSQSCSLRLRLKFPAVPAANKQKLTLCGLVASCSKLTRGPATFRNRIDYLHEQIFPKVLREVDVAWKYRSYILLRFENISNVSKILNYLLLR